MIDRFSRFLADFNWKFILDGFETVNAVTQIVTLFLKG